MMNQGGQCAWMSRPELKVLQAFQQARLARSFADFNARPRYQAAIRFFLEELYAGRNSGERDRQVEKVLPLMARLLPDHAMQALTGALELQALSLDLDQCMSVRMEGQGLAQLDEKTYADVYRDLPRADREKQLELIERLGMELCRLARHRGLLLLIRAMRRPAHAAGFGLLQEFLERGLSAVRAMGRHGPAFIETIVTRETRVMQRLYDEDPDPFRR